MKINSKNSYYVVVIATGILAILLTLKTLKSNNKYPNKTVIQKTLMEYYSGLPQNNNSYFINKTFPFYLSIPETKKQTFNMKYFENENTLILENIHLLSEKEFNLLNLTIQQFSIDKNTETPIVSFLLPSKIPTFRQINIYFLLHSNENIEDYQQYHSVIEDYSREHNNKTQMNIYIKYVFYNIKNKVFRNKDLYGEMKILNSKLLFEEINDEDSISFFIVDSANTSNNTINNRLLYNEDLKHLIVNIDLNKDLNATLLSQIILLESIKWFIPLSNLPSMFLNNNNLNELIKIYYSKQFQYYLLLSLSMKNCDKLNKIFPLYETIRTIDKVKEKVV